MCLCHVFFAGIASKTISRARFGTYRWWTGGFRKICAYFLLLRLARVLLAVLFKKPVNLDGIIIACSYPWERCVYYFFLVGVIFQKISQNGCPGRPEPPPRALVLTKRSE